MIQTNLSFGCHNLTGGSSYRRSETLVHCALDLGIRRFDVAPSYGLGTAESTLARALGKRRLDPAIEIATKYGILPPRFGPIAVWLREPRRALALHLRRADGPVPRLVPTAGASALYMGTARAAAEASLRAMRLDRIGVFLSHERLYDSLAEQFRVDMENLLREGLVESVGCSGELANVTYMLSKAHGVATVAQVSIRHHDAIAGVGGLRIFNLGAFARLILERGTLPAGLRDALPGRDDLDAAGLAIAGVLTWVRRRFPRAICILNASTPHRLAAVVEASEERSLSTWAREQNDALAHAMSAAK